MTKTQKQAYFNSGGNKCPFCQSDDIEGGTFQSDCDTAWQDITCNGCEKTWQDVYTLTDVEEVK